MQNRCFRRLAALAALPFAAAACEGDGPNTPRIIERLALTVNSVENSLSLVPVDGGQGTQSRAVGLGSQGTPVGVAARGAWAVVPLGTYPFAAVVANSSLNTVTPVNVLRGTAGAQVQVGTFPQAMVSDGARIYVLNANLVNFTPAGPGSVTVLDEQLRLVKTVQVSGINPSAAAFIGNRLYVLNAGTFGGNNGSLSVVNLQTLSEESHHPGFGNYPSSIAASDEGELYVGIYGTGIVVWNPRANEFRVPLASPLQPGGSGIVAGLGFDHTGRLHTLNPGSCQTPGVMNRLTSDAVVDRTVPVGICPFGLAFADVPEAEED